VRAGLGKRARSTKMLNGEPRMSTDPVTSQPPTVKRPETASGTGDTLQPAGPPPVEGSYPFLAPAQAPDELGWLGGYRILKVLGQGGMGIVFLAEDAQLKRHVALKVMRPAFAAREDARQRFLREAQAMAAPPR
jgi:serine/threonine protein kinase